jgi:hypothetical protein
METNRKNGHAGICVEFSNNSSDKYIISNTNIVELLYSIKAGFIFVNMCEFTKMSFYIVTLTDKNLSVKSVSMPELNEIEYEPTEFEHKVNEFILKRAFPAVV